MSKADTPNILFKNENNRKKIKEDNYPNRVFLIISGSKSEISEKQLNYLQAYKNVGTFNVSVDAVASREYEQLERIEWAVESILKLIRNKKIVIIRRCGNTLINGITGKFQKQLSMEIVKTLGVITRLVMEKGQSEIKCIILTGGDTAEEVIKSLGSYGIWIDSEVRDGIPLGFLYQGPYDGFPVITKAGAFGEENTLKICTEYFPN